MWETILSIGRTPKLGFESEEALKQAAITCNEIRNEAFPTLELEINVKTGPTSVVSISLYPDPRSAASKLPVRGNFQKTLGKKLIDSSM